MSENTTAAIENLTSLCEEFIAAIRVDPGYAIQMANDAGRVQRGRAVALARHAARREGAA
jgi:hypothetical protein